MKTSMVFALAILFVVAGISLAPGQQTAPAGIDWAKARLLRQREGEGGQLSAEEKAYLDKARAEVAAGRGPGAGSRGNLPSPTSQQAKTGLVPLNQMTAADRYKGEDGGLYGKGQNSPPKEHLQAAIKALSQVQPLDKDGNPAKDGKIALMSLGMSNTTNEFAVFKQKADADPDRNPRLVIVDGAQGGQAAKQWNNAESKVWAVAAQRLAQAGVTTRQVQVMWLKQAQQGPAMFGEFPKHARELQGDIIKDIQQAKAHYPNLRVIYLSSRVYAGYASTPLNPEPYAYEGAYVVRWVIQDQINGSSELNHDPSKGEVKAPVLLWGPYLWADGIAGRKSDSLVWKREDLASDGTHPSESGREKVAAMLLDFFKKDPAVGSWFLKEQPTERK